MYNYSVIIPHFNSPQLLERCLQSIPKREDIQVIVIDDCSKEPHIAILHVLEKKFNSVQFIYSPQNEGAGAARNKGLQKVSGKWLIFADADDFFTSNAFDTFDIYKQTDNDLILFINKAYSDNDTEHHRGDFINNNIIAHINGELPAQTAALCCWAPWAKMVSTNYVKANNFHFEEVPFANDVFWNTQIVANTNKIFFSNEAVYNLSLTNNSLTTFRNKEAFFTRYKVTEKINKYLTSIDKKNLTQPITMEFATWARSFGLIFYINFITKSIRNGSIFEGKETNHFLGKLKSGFFNKHPFIFFTSLFFIPSLFLRSHKAFNRLQRIKNFILNSK